jgi:hypothetical protein
VNNPSQRAPAAHHTDERIQSTRRRIAAHVASLWYILLLAALLYRQVYLQQPVREYWDVGLIFLVGAGYMVIANFAQGTYSETFPRYVAIALPIMLATILLALAWRGQLATPADWLWAILAALTSMGVLVLVFYVLHRRWEKRSGLTD